MAEYSASAMFALDWRINFERFCGAGASVPALLIGVMLPSPVNCARVVEKLHAHACTQVRRFDKRPRYRSASLPSTTGYMASNCSPTLSAVFRLRVCFIDFNDLTVFCTASRRTLVAICVFGDFLLPLFIFSSALAVDFRFF